MTSERTEQPTQKRRDDARAKGQVAVSREVDSAFVLLASLLAFRFAGPRLWHGLEDLMRDALTQMARDPITQPLATDLGVDLVWRAISLLLPLFGAIAAVGVLVGVAQSGGVLSAKAVAPQVSRLNPIKGLQRTIASKQAAVTLLKTLLKFVVIGGAAGWTLYGRMDEVIGLGLTASIPQSLGVLFDIATDIAVKVLTVLLALAVADLLFQRYELLSQLRMTRQEVKDEHRQSEGDPAVKARIARLRRSFLTRIMQAVPQADVVLTNPTHYAVALKYDPTTSAAPKVIAKGERLMAQRIRELATEHGIPVIQNPPLTRAIYRAVPVGREITPDLYEAVAAILAFVYRLRYPRARAVA